MASSNIPGQTELPEYPFLPDDGGEEQRSGYDFMRAIVPHAKKGLIKEQGGVFHSGGEPWLNDAEFLRATEWGEAIKKWGGENISPLGSFESTLPPERQHEMLSLFVYHYQRAQEWKGHFQEPPKNLTPETAEKSIWAVPATAPDVVFRFRPGEEGEMHAKENELSAAGHDFDEKKTDDGSVIIAVHGHRMNVAFLKHPCPHKCNYCGLSKAMDAVKAFEQKHGPITPEMQLRAFQDGLKKTKADEKHPHTIELLNDGSWYHDAEIALETRRLIASDIAGREYVQCFSVESRPEHIAAEKVRDDLSSLRPGQKLKIYMGLETDDHFVSTLVQKEYSWTEFEAAVRMISGMAEEEKRRISITAYNIMKNPFLTEREALEAGVHIEKRVAALSQATGVPIEVKHEPTVVSKGTLQHYFFHQINEKGERLYENLSYFTVAELLARLAEEGLERNAVFGQRDDIDQVQIVAMVPSLKHDLLYSPYDFIAYDAVQNFNGHRDERRFLAEISPAIQNPDGSFTDEFEAWEKKMYPDGKSALRKKLEEISAADPFSKDDLEKAPFSRAVCSLLSELGEDILLQELAGAGELKELSVELEERFKKLSEQFGSKFERVNNMLAVNLTEYDRYQRNTPGAKTMLDPGYQIEVILYRNEIPISVWFYIQNGKAN